MARDVKTITIGLITTRVITEVIHGKNIVAQISITQEGMSLLIVGGDKSHIGAVAIVTPEGKLSCTTFPTHKDSIIAKKWALELWNRYKVSAVVSVGIHYDNITKKMIEEILLKTDNMMEELFNEKFNF